MKARRWSGDYREEDLLKDSRIGIWDWLSEPVPEMAVIIEESEVQ